MSSVNFISFEKFMSRLHSDMPNSTFTREAQVPKVKQYVYRALRKIGSPRFNVKRIIEVKVEGKMGTFPESVNFLRSITYNGLPMSKVESFMDVRYLNTPAYMINGMNIHTNFEEGTLDVEVIEFPRDEMGNPLILNSEEVIQALYSFVMYNISKKLWINNKVDERVYREFERDWLYYVNTATTATLMPDFDAMNEWFGLSSIMPLSRLQPLYSNSGAVRVVD